MITLDCSLFAPCGKGVLVSLFKVVPVRPIFRSAFLSHSTVLRLQNGLMLKEESKSTDGLAGALLHMCFVAGFYSCVLLVFGLLFHTEMILGIDEVFFRTAASHELLQVVHIGSRANKQRN